MKRLSVLLLAVLAACSSQVKEPPKAAPPAVPHEAAFRGSVDSALAAYYTLTEAFVNWDSVRVQTAAGALQEQVGRLTTEVVPKEKSIPVGASVALLHKVNGGLEQIRNTTGIEAQRHAFSDLTKSFYSFLTTAGYSGNAVYYQVCPMAFNDVDSGYWLSKADAVRNPYIGVHHPTYGGGMVGCGDIEDSIAKAAK